MIDVPGEIGDQPAVKQPDSLAIQTFGLSRTFGDFVAVDGLDLSVGDGELFSVLGPNGAGKTTTIKMLCCLLRPTAGTARIRGHDILTDPLAVKRAIAVSPQETAIAPLPVPRSRRQGASSPAASSIARSTRCSVSGRGIRTVGPTSKSREWNSFVPVR